MMPPILFASVADLFHGKSYGAIQGMVAALGDPYTVFLPPKENKMVKDDLGGNFDGVGIQIGFKGKQLTVIAPLPGTPAACRSARFMERLAGKGDAVNQKAVGKGAHYPG